MPTLTPLRVICSSLLTQTACESEHQAVSLAVEMTPDLRDKECNGTAWEVLETSLEREKYLTPSTDTIVIDPFINELLRKSAISDQSGKFRSRKPV